MNADHTSHSTRKRATRATWRALFAVLALLLWTHAAAASNVLVLWDDDAASVQNNPPQATELNAGTQALIAALEAAGLKVTLSDKTQHQYTALNPVPAAFDAVIHLNGNTTSTLNVMRSSAVLKLLDYVQNKGGGFIGSENTEAQIEIPFVGLNRAMQDLMLLDRVNGPPQPYGEMTLTKIPAQLNHPLLTGLQNQFSFVGARMNSELRSYATGPATAILNDDAGVPAAAVRDFGLGRVVSFHHAGNFRSLGNLSDTLKDPNVQRLYVNAVRWADQKAPERVSLLRAASTPTNAANVRYTVIFNEAVTGVNPSDFRANIAGGFTTFPQIFVDEIGPTEYDIRLTGISGTGSLSLTLLNNGSIVDRSFNQNSLAGGEFDGPTFFVDAVKPVIHSFTNDHPVVLEGEKAKLSIEFSEPMQTALKPTVTIETAANGKINASPVGSIETGLPPRIATDLIAFYAFNDGGGSRVLDSSGSGNPLNLEIANPDFVTWHDGYVTLNDSTIMASDGPATKLYDGVTATGELTLEAWVRPANGTQNGPARMVTYSIHTGSRNATLGQDSGNYSARVRTTDTSVNGTPEVLTEGGVAVGGLQHVVYTRAEDGTARIYINGALVAEENIPGGINLSTWDSTFAFGLGNEFTLSRPWLGEFHLAAFYKRALDGAEVAQNYAAGPNEGRIGDGQWNGAFVYEVTFDRSVVEADEGTAIVRIAGAKDVPGNTMTTDASHTVAIIQGKLVIVNQPDAYAYAAAGANKTLKVTVFGGVGLLHYEWFREDGEGIFVSVGGNTATLLLEELDLSDTGNYFCVVTDDISIAQTAPSFIEVVPALPVAKPRALAVLVITVLLMGASMAGPRRQREGKD